MYRFLVLLSICSIQASFASEKISLHFNGANQMLDTIAQKIGGEIENHYSLPNMDLSECRKEGYVCELSDIQGTPNFNSNHKQIFLKLFAGELFGLGISLPQGELSANIRVGGKVLGIKYDVKFRVKLKSLVPHGRLDTRADFLEHGGMLKFLLVNDRLQVKAVTLPKIKFQEIQVTPTDNLAKIVYKTLSAFMNIEQTVLDAINQKTLDIVSSDKLIHLFEEKLNVYTDRSLKIAVPFKEFGLKVALEQYSLKSQDNKFEFEVLTDIAPMYPAADCTEDFRTYGPYKEKKEGFKSAGELAIPLSLIPKVLFTYIKHPPLQNLEDRTFPCFESNEKFSFGPFKFDLNVKGRPVGKLQYRFYPETNSIDLWMDIFFEASNIKKFPSISFNRTRGLKRLDGAVLRLKLNYQFQSLKDGHYLVLKGRDITKFDGRATIGVFGKKRGLSVKLKRFKSLLLSEIDEMIKDDFRQIKMLDSTTHISDGIQLSLKQLKIDDKFFKFLFAIE